MSILKRFLLDYVIKVNKTITFISLQVQQKLECTELVINLATLHDYVQTECSNLSSLNRNGRFSMWLESKTSYCANC